MTLTSVKLTKRSSQLASRDVRWLHHRIDSTFESHRTLWTQRTPEHILVRHDRYRPGADMSWIASAGVIDDKRVNDGDQVTLRLIACPCKSIRTTAGKRGTRTPIPPGRDQITWAYDRISGAIDIENLTASPLRTFFGYKSSGIVTIKRVQYIVTGRIANAAEVNRMIDDGVGPDKAYGCGMVVVS
ncbi:MAG: type I-E CRISPR-associated protein Cas6/Cse3/CasE [Pseudomonas aeruginosa]|jgi:CRISPR associated protein|uniref:type I-E CRISPR-associated protein Cas6/Cse3/CasE n=1 Tax=Cutibacterium avidum TaxID=33010 RepID=UPI00290BAE1A|nr:type I-E CRISPR-associated protein Cas6/Cse3/CasE [Pseudomonas aeruginosa]